MNEFKKFCVQYVMPNEKDIALATMAWDKAIQLAIEEFDNYGQCSIGDKDTFESTMDNLENLISEGKRDIL